MPDYSAATDERFRGQDPAEYLILASSFPLTRALQLGTVYRIVSPLITEVWGWKEIRR